MMKDGSTSKKSIKRLGMIGICAVCAIALFGLLFLLSLKNSELHKDRIQDGHSIYDNEEPGYYSYTIEEVVTYTEPIYAGENQICFDDKEMTNKDHLSISVLVKGGPYDMHAINNDIEQCIGREMIDNSYSIDVPLVEGANKLEFYLANPEGDRSDPVYWDVISDREPPLLSMDKEWNAKVIDEDAYEVSGTVKDFKSFQINGTEYEIVNGRFSVELATKDNPTLFVSATDAAGNVRSYIGYVSYDDMGGGDNNLTKAIRIVLCLVLTIVFVWWFVSTVRQYRQDGNKKKLIREIASLLIPCLLILLLFTRVLLVTKVASGSMEPTLMTGDIEICTRIFNRIERGDVVIFYSEEFDENFGKRVIGLPGDRIEFVDDAVVVNGKILDESAYLGLDVTTKSLFKNRIYEVPEGCYFMLGDNRDYSYDSRLWEQPYIPIEDIRGKSILCLNDCIPTVYRR